MSLLSSSFKDRAYRLLRSSERYTRTDMVYLASSSFWLNAQFLYTSVLAFTLSIAFAFILSKEAFGTYQYILSVSSILAAFTLSGFNTVIARSVAQGYAGTLRASIRPQLLWNAVPALAGLALSLYYFWNGNAVLGAGILCVALTLPIINAFSSYTPHLTGEWDFKRASLYGIGASTAYYLCIFVAVAVIPEVLSLIAVNLLTTAGASIYFYIRTVHRVPRDAPADPDALPYARHVSVMNALGTIATQVDNLIVFHLFGAAELALYSIAKLLPERAGGIFKIITFSTTLPRFANRALPEIRRNLLYRLALLLVVILAAAGAYALLAPFLFGLAYPAYADAIPYSQLYSLVLVSHIGGVASSVLYAHRNVRSLYSLNVGMPILQIALQLLGAFLWGVWGLIGGRIVSVAVLSITSVILVLRQPRSSDA